jgi:hypothetical protein
MSSDGFLEKNLAALRLNYPELAAELEAAESGCAFRVEPAASGEPSAVFAGTGLHVHSNRDPRREGLRQAEAALSGFSGPVVVFGFGLGYAAEAAARAETVIVAERRPDLFRLALECRDLSAFFSAQNLMFLLGGESGGITGALSLLDRTGVREKPRILKNRALISLSPEDERWYSDAERLVQSWASRGEVNAATLRRFGRRWTKNLAANLAFSRDLGGVHWFEGCLNETGIPVFLAAAGPSLDETTPYLAAFRERCLIVAVDTSLRFLLEQGIDSDFTVSVDPQFWNARHLQRLDPKRGGCLIAESAVYPSVLREWTGRALLCRSLFPLGRFIEDRTDPKGALGAGGSVATTAWDFARLLGPSMIWIAGLDLAFPGLKTHFKGALFEEGAHTASTRLLPAETRSVLSLENGQPFRAASASGGSVLTDRRLSLYGAWFENRVRQEKKLRSLSLSRSGLAIGGIVPSSPEELLVLPPRRKELDRILKEVFDRAERDFNAPEAKKLRAEHCVAALESLEEGIRVLRNHARRSRNALSAFHSGAGQERETLLAKLETANRAIRESPVKEAAGFLFPPVAELEARLRQTDPWKRHLEFSTLLYEELDAAAEFTLAALDRAPFKPDRERNG